MKRVWKWLKQFLSSDPPPTPIQKEDEVEEAVNRILRKMNNGNWSFSWRLANQVDMVVVHRNLPHLTDLITNTRVAILGGLSVPSEARLSPYSNKGTVTVSLANYIANDEGLFREPTLVVRDFAMAVKWLSNSIREVRANNHLKADALTGQCVYLYQDILVAAKVLL